MLISSLMARVPSAFTGFHSGGSTLEVVPLAPTSYAHNNQWGCLAGPFSFSLVSFYLYRFLFSRITPSHDPLPLASPSFVLGMQTPTFSARPQPFGWSSPFILRLAGPLPPTDSSKGWWALRFPRSPLLVTVVLRLGWPNTFVSSHGLHTGHWKWASAVPAVKALDAVPLTFTRSLVLSPGGPEMFPVPVLVCFILKIQQTYWDVPWGCGLPAQIPWAPGSLSTSLPGGQEALAGFQLKYWFPGVFLVHHLRNSYQT